MPGIAVFPEEAVASHDVPLHESMLADGLKHVLGGSGAVVAARAANVGQDVVVEENYLLGEAPHGGELSGRRGFLGPRGADARISAPGLDVADFGVEEGGEEE